MSSPSDPSELRGALELVASGDTRTLTVAALGDVAHSLGELLHLLDWLEDRGASLVSRQPPLDTASAAGQAAVELLREVHRWEREPVAPRRPRGRPGLASSSPELAHRIAELRERGLSLQAIADELNRDGVPTPRGGAGWRPSSVQSVLGYRRPRPPLGGPPRPHRPPGPPKPPGPGAR